MKAMIIFLVFVMQSAAQLLFAQNLTIEVCDIEKVEGHLYVAIYNSEETFMKKPLTAFRIDVKDTSLSINGNIIKIVLYIFELQQYTKQ